MKIVFFGNTKYSLIGAKIIYSSLGLSQIVTLPDRPDKKRRLMPNPLKTFASEKNIPVLTLDKLDDETWTHVASLRPDFIVVEDYGLILPEKLLALPKYASLNIHHSLLPKYRGPSPAPTAILNGDNITGVTVMKMTERIDAGDILAQKEYVMKPDETTYSLLTVLNTLGAELLVTVINDYQNTKQQPQDEKKATVTNRMKKEDGYFTIDNPPSPATLDRMIRAYFPWPTVWTRWNGKILKILPGKRVQLEGGREMSYKDFLNG